MLIDSFLICFWQFYFLTPSYDFAKAMAFAWRPFWPIFKMVSFFEYSMFFFRGFLHRITQKCF